MRHLLPQENLRRRQEQEAQEEYIPYPFFLRISPRKQELMPILSKWHLSNE